MKIKIALFLFCLVIILCGFSFNNLSQNVSQSNVANSVTSSSAFSYIVLNSDTNQILEGKNYLRERSVASISKVMTAIVAIENSDLKKIVKIPQQISEVYGSMIYLKIGDEVTIEELIYGLMLRSGNDAAISIAIGVSENVVAFVELMNKKAKDIGMSNSNFKNPHGLDEDDGGNISSSYDMALLMSYAMKNIAFQKITSTDFYKNEEKSFYWNNKMRLLKSYDPINGGKTGYTKKAKRTLVTSANKNHMNIVIVTLDCGNDFNLHLNLYEKYFNDYQAIIALKKGDNYNGGYNFKASDNIIYIIEKKDIKKYSIIIEVNEITNFAVVILLKDNVRIAYYQCEVLKLKNNLNKNLGMT